MKVYDTDEKAVAAGARRQTLAKVIQFVIMLAFSAFGLWAFYALVLAPDKSTGMLPASQAVCSIEARPVVALVTQSRYQLFSSASMALVVPRAA